VIVKPGSSASGLKGARAAEKAIESGHCKEVEGRVRLEQRNHRSRSRSRSIVRRLSLGRREHDSARHEARW